MSHLPWEGHREEPLRDWALRTGRMSRKDWLAGKSLEFTRPSGWRQVPATALSLFVYGFVVWMLIAVVNGWNL